MTAGLPPVVNAFADRLRQFFGPRLVGVYLGCSVVMDDFVEGSSDYDLLVIVADDLSSRDLSALDALHRQLRHEFPDAIRLEGDYVPLRTLRPEGTSEPVSYFRRGRLQAEPGLMLSADNIANIRQAGINVLGPSAPSVLPDVTPEQVREAVRAMLSEEPECPTEEKAANEILDLVRSFRALETGTPTTKTAGLRWGLANLGEAFHPLLRRADGVRRGAPVARDDRTLRAGFVELRAALRRGQL